MAEITAFLDEWSEAELTGDVGAWRLGRIHMSFIGGTPGRRRFRGT